MPELFRSRLTQRLAFHTGERGVVVHGPAGWGKTTALRHYLHGAGDAADVVWVDARPGIEADALWAQLREGYSRLVGAPPEEGRGVEGMVAVLSAGYRMPTFLVVDDAHHAPNRWAEDLARAIDLTGQGIYFDIVTRGPLPAALEEMLHRETLVSVGPDDLAFAAVEVQELRALSGLQPLGASELVELMASTAGCPSLLAAGM